MEPNRLNYRIRAFRQALGITQEELGALVGVSNFLISLHERGMYDVDGRQNELMQALYEVQQRKAAVYGYWYNNYVELQTALNEVQVWIELEGRAPTEVIRHAKDLAVAFSNT